MLNSSVGATGEWLSAEGGIWLPAKAVQFLLRLHLWGNVSFPHLQTPTERSRNSVFLLLIDQADMCFACFSVF